jgi:hypothetical protein
LAIVALVTSLFTPSHLQARPGYVSRYANLSQCREVEHAPADEDWVYFRCKGFGSIAVWYVCTDSARCRYGFGIKPNVSSWMFGTNRQESWLIEWRGIIRRGRFQPFAAILRARSADPDEPKSFLAIYRLRSNGTSCIVGQTNTNSRARRIADEAAGDYRCVDKPQLL